MTKRSNDNPDRYGSLIERYIREHFKKLVPGVFARWWGEPLEYSYEIRSIREHEASQYFSRCALLRVSVEDDFLWHKLRGGGSEGIFAVSDDRVVYLTPDCPDAVESALGGSVALKALIPEVLAPLCCEVLLSRADARYSVVTSGKEIEAWYPVSRGYVPGDDYWQRCEECLRAPRWQHEEAGPSLLVFFALVTGFQSYQIRRIALTLPIHGGLALDEEVVVARVFKQTPKVRA